MSMKSVQGTVAPGFEAVADTFAASDFGVGGGAFAAYVEGEKVADLWGGDAHAGQAWQRDTLNTAMSATKGMAALCLLVLHDRGLIDVDAPVVTYWPEYGQAGKQDTLVRHILDHTCGVLGFDDPGAFLDWSGGGWDDYDEIARGLAAAEPAWEPGTRIAYHAVSFGWLCQELVRRVAGVTLGTFFAREIAEPLGLSIFIGTPESEQRRIATPVHGAIAESSPEAEAIHAMFRAMLADPGTPLGRSSIAMHGSSLFEHMDFLDLSHVRSTEIPAVNGTMDARSLAKVYAALAMGGELDGVRLASEKTVRLFGTKSFSGPSAFWQDSAAPDALGTTEMRYALGFEGDFGTGPRPWRFGPTLDTFGHLGAGGQVGFADPVRKVSIGFVRNHHSEWQVSTSLVESLYAQL